MNCSEFQFLVLGNYEIVISIVALLLKSDRSFRIMQSKLYKNYFVFIFLN